MNDSLHQPANDPSALKREIQVMDAQIQQLSQQLARQASHSRSLAQRVLALQEDERRKVARELHDGLGQSLTLLTHDIGRLEDQADGPMARELKDLRAKARACLDETRELSRLLRPPILDDLGLGPALQHLMETVGKRAEIRTVCRVPSAQAQFGNQLSTVLYRVAQEAVTNAVKHAQPTLIALTLSQIDSRIRLLIMDDGHGFDAENDEHADSFGLRSMRERLALFEGHLHIDSSPESGTTIRAEVKT